MLGWFARSGVLDAMSVIHLTSVRTVISPCECLATSLSSLSSIFYPLYSNLFIQAFESTSPSHSTFVSEYAHTGYVS